MTAVFGPIDVVARVLACEGPAARSAPLAGRVLGDRHDHPGHGAVEHADIEQASLAGSLALAEVGQDAGGGVHGRAQVGDLDGRDGRNGIRPSAQAEDAGAGGEVEIVPGPVAVRSVLAEPGDRTVNDPRIDGPDGLVADAQPVDRAGAEALDDDPGGAGELEEKVAPGRGLEIEGDALLARVQGQEIGALAVDEGRHRADVVAGLEVLDLDDLGAKVGQEQRAERAGQEP
jgi:hypothetical protein